MKSEAAKELKPCPFCGSEPITEPNEEYYTVTCSRDACVLGNMAISKAVWNTRYEAARPAPADEEVREAVEDDVQIYFNAKPLHLPRKQMTGNEIIEQATLNGLWNANDSAQLLEEMPNGNATVIRLAWDVRLRSYMSLVAIVISDNA